MIPNVFHFVFGLREQTEPFHLMYYLCLESCIEVNQPDAVVFHTHHEPWGPWWDRIRSRLEVRRIEPERFVAEHDYRDASLAPYRYAHLADFARLRILLEEGGIYADIDTLFLQPLPDEWFRREFILGREKPPSGAEASLCNAWIASAPGARFCRRWLDDMYAAFDGSWSNHSTLLPWRLSRAMPDELHIEPESAFYALDWSPKSIDDLFLRDTCLPPDARSLHLWNHLWWDSKRLDFSRFHAGMLTADYVAHANTTYARHARRFLTSDIVTSEKAWLRADRLNAARHPLHALRSTLRAKAAS